MNFDDFLGLCKVIRMLYGTEFAIKFFEKNIDLYYNLDSISITKRKEQI